MTTNQFESAPASAANQGRDRLPRLSLNLDALASGALGVLLAAAGAVLDGLLGIPAATLVPVGVFLVAYAAALWYIGSRPQVSRPAVWVVVVGNLGWVAASVVAAAAGWWSPTAHGHRARARSGRCGRGLRRAAVHRPSPIPRRGGRPGPSGRLGQPGDPRGPRHSLYPC
jgi:hypothetical protein